MAGCGSHEPEGRWIVAELTSPAGEGSGEPFLSSSGDKVLLSWLERTGPETHELRFARLEGDEWSEWKEPTVVRASDRFLVNWADFPSVSPGADGELWAHWLERGPAGTSGYGIRIAHSADGGATWSEPWTPHEDASATDHGFVSGVDVGGERGFFWLDGRKRAAEAEGASPGETALYFRSLDPQGLASPEVVVDERVCDCCQTDMALTSAGPVGVYRGRSREEVRDIRLKRFVDGVWSEGRVVHEDGWETGACPVNGPSVAARGMDVVVAWFTAVGGVPRVEVAFSDNGGEGFGRPLVADDGNPAGRVDVVMLDDRSAVVSWIERTGGDGAEVRVRRVEPHGRVGGSVRVSGSSTERASGFPRLAGGAGAPLIVAWTDATEITMRVRVARIELETDPRTGEGT